jgi:hypothetical protein
MNIRRGHLLREPRILIGGSVLLSIVLIAALAPFLAPHDPNQQDLLNVLVSPAWNADGDIAFPFGTDGTLVLRIFTRDLAFVFGAKRPTLLQIPALAPRGNQIIVHRQASGKQRSLLSFRRIYSDSVGWSPVNANQGY